MRKRVPVPRDQRPPVPEFTPVPRKYRHDGWTPERQKAFIEALADCGSVRRAAEMVNMSNVNAYALRRAPGAESFRAAWAAAQDFGVLRLKDIAFERAIEGQLYPEFRNGKLIGFTRRKNDALLMFCLRHYDLDANGRRTTINYFSTKAVAGAGAGAGVSTSLDTNGGVAGSEASTTTVRTVINGPSAGSGQARGEEAAGVLEGFEGVALDPEAQAAIAAALEACAARARAACEAEGEAAADWAEDDSEEAFIALPHNGSEYRGSFEPPVEVTEFVPVVEGEGHWHNAGADLPDWATPEALEAIRAAVKADKLCDNSPVAPAPRKRDNRRKKVEDL